MRIFTDWYGMNGRMYEWMVSHSDYCADQGSYNIACSNTFLHY